MKYHNSKVLVFILGLLFCVYLSCDKDSPNEPANAKMAIDVEILDFGSNQSEQSFIITNAGDKDLSWEITSYPDWLTLSPLTGVNKDTVTATADREALESGSFSGDIVIASNGGDVSIPVSIDCPLEYLEYDNNLHDGYVTVGQANGIIWVRFTCPYDWSSCILQKVELDVWQDSTVIPFDIVYQDDYYVYEWNYYPKYYSFDNLLENCSQDTELKEWDVDNTVFTSRHFFVGIRVSSDLGPYLYADNSGTMYKRSGSNFYYYPFNRIMLFTDINIHVRIYVTPGNSNLHKPVNSEAVEGIWFDSREIDLKRDENISVIKIIE